MYVKGNVPLKTESLPEAVDTELTKIQNESQRPEVDGIQFKIWHSEPPKPRTGIAYYADGSDWNPGSGEGLYIYTSGAAWSKL